jgi:hypothetical protein
VAKTTELEAKLAKKDGVIAEVTAELVATKRAWGALSGRWVPPDIRDTIVDFVRVWSDKTESAADRFVAWSGHGARQVLRLEEALRQGQSTTATCRAIIDCSTKRNAGSSAFTSDSPSRATAG